MTHNPLRPVSGVSPSGWQLITCQFPGNSAHTLTTISGSHLPGHGTALAVHTTHHHQAVNTGEIMHMTIHWCMNRISKQTAHRHTHIYIYINTASFSVNDASDLSIAIGRWLVGGADPEPSRSRLPEFYDSALTYKSTEAIYCTQLGIWLRKRHARL